jgi:hypothetical protein
MILPGTTDVAPEKCVSFMSLTLAPPSASLQTIINMGIAKGMSVERQTGVEGKFAKKPSLQNKSDGLQTWLSLQALLT